MPASEPPAENSEATRARSWIIYSFWVVIVVLGLPTWWQTTSIPRSALPIEEMLSWSNNAATQSVYSVPIRVAAPEIPCKAALDLVTATQAVLNEKTKLWGFETALSLVRLSDHVGQEQHASAPSCPLQTVSFDVPTTSFDVELKPGPAFHLDVVSGLGSAVATYVPGALNGLARDLAQALQEVFVDEQAAVAYQYHSQGRHSSELSAYISSLPSKDIKMIEENAARAFKPSPEYYLTFSLFTPGGSPSSWDINSVLTQQIQPLVHALSTSMNFSIATQVQVYSIFSPSIQPFQEENGKTWYLRRSDLTAFVNTAEWPLSPSIGSGPTMNFVLYVPSTEQTPLRIEGSHDSGPLGGSWIVPQWGGITILNAPIVRNDPEIARDDVIQHLTTDLLRPAFEVFQSQLLSLLGVAPSSSTTLPLRLKAFQRLAAFSLHVRTSSNLASLARLAQHLSNIPIPRHVSDLVNSAMDNLGAYQKDTSESNGITAASNGYKASEKAFFDKSMVGQVYFPDEHKVAVYLPLLGPIGVPLVVGLLRELKALAARLRS